MASGGGPLGALLEALEVLRGVFMALAKAEATIDRKGSDGRQRYVGLIRAGQRLSARIAMLEGAVARLEPRQGPSSGESMLGRAADLAPGGGMPTRRQCAAIAQRQGRRQRLVMFLRTCARERAAAVRAWPGGGGASASVAPMCCAPER